MEPRSGVTNEIAVYMDHRSACLFSFMNEQIQTSEIFASESGHERIPGEGGDGMRLGNFRSTNNEHHKHNVEQNVLHQYFNDIKAHLLNFDSILLFGPTTAKDELHNLLEADQHFRTKKIVVRSTDQLTEPQMVDHAKRHFDIPLTA